MGHSRHKGLFVGPFRLRMRLALDAVNKHDFSMATREHEVSGCVDKISWDATRDVFCGGRSDFRHACVRASAQAESYRADKFPYKNGRSWYLEGRLSLIPCSVEAGRLAISRPRAHLIGQMVPRGWDRNLSIPSCPTAWQLNIASDVGVADAPRRSRPDGSWRSKPASGD